MSDEVVIRIPASTPHIGMVRSAASSLAALLDFTYDRIQDLHIAIDEVCSRIMATSDPPAGRLEIRFRLEEGELHVSARGDSPLKSETPFLTTWSQAILRAVTDGLEVVDTDSEARVTFRLGRGVSV